MIRGSHHTPEIKARMSAASRQLHADPAIHRRMIRGLLAQHERIRSDPKYRAKHARLCAAGIRRSWKDKSFRARRIAEAKAAGFWNAANDADLHSLHSQGMSAREIADAFGPPVTRNMVIGRLWRVRNGAA